MRFIEGPVIGLRPKAEKNHNSRRPFFERRLSVITRAFGITENATNWFVPVENQGSNMYPTVVAFAILPSDLHAKSKPSRNVKSLHNARGLSAIHPQNHPLDSAKTRKKTTQTIPLVFISSADPG